MNLFLAISIFLPFIFSAPPPREPWVPLITCSCDGDHYNCSDFPTWNDAQLCYQGCMVLGLGDPHDLDRDADMVACEDKADCPKGWGK